MNDLLKRKSADMTNGMDCSGMKRPSKKAQRRKSSRKKEIVGDEKRQVADENASNQVPICPAQTQN